MKDVILLVLGAIAGVIAQSVYASTKSLWTKHRTALRRRRTAHLDNSAAHSRNILAIYQQRGLANELYKTQTLDGQLLPILPVTQIRFEGQIDPAEDDLVTLDRAEPATFSVDQRLIAKKIARGATLWDGPALYLKSIDVDPTGSSVLAAGICNYYSYVTLAQQIVDEIRTTVGDKPLLTGRVRRLPETLQNRQSPITLAATVCCVFESDHGPVVALQRRSHAVVNAAGMMGVVPIFGLESHRIGETRSKYGIIHYNFLKEFIEEFFGLEAVIRAASNPRSDPDWIFHLPNAPELTAQVDNGDLTLSYTGAGIDLSDGSLTIALVAHFTSPIYQRLLASTAVGSWESAEATPGQPAIEFVPINAPSLAKGATINRMDPSSIFSIDLARQRFDV